MARQLRISYPNAFYHVTCRGNDRRVIFRDDHDRTRFLAQLENALEIFSVQLHAYVPMSNHFHLIVESPEGRADCRNKNRDPPSTDRWTRGRLRKRPERR